MISSLVRDPKGLGMPSDFQSLAGAAPDSNGKKRDWRKLLISLQNLRQTLIFTEASDND
jgi:hypothetical protein